MTLLRLLFSSCKRVDDVRDFVDDSGLKVSDDVTLSTENIQILSNCFLKIKFFLNQFSETKKTAGKKSRKK